MSTRGRTRLKLETLEDRTLMSSAPLLSVTGHVDISKLTGIMQNSIDTGNESSPSVAVDPTNPNHLVVAYTVHQPTTTGNSVEFIGVAGNYSLDGGQHWLNLAESGPSVVDPETVTTTGGAKLYAFASNPTVAFDRQENVYVLRSEHSADETSGALVLDSFHFNSGTSHFDAGLQNKIVYQWVNGRDEALNPVLAVDSGVQSYQMQQDAFAGNIYVAWDTVTAPFSNAGSAFNPNSIKAVVSSDGGQTFSGQFYLNQSPDFSDNAGNPALTISQGTSSGSIPGGQLLATWDTFGPDSQDGTVHPRDIIAAPVQGGTELTKTDSAGGAINAPVVQGQTATTNFIQTVLPNDFGSGFTTLSKLSVSLVLRHPSLSQLQIQLISPDNQSVTLVLNRIDSQGMTANAAVGIAGTSMGILNPNIGDNNALFSTQKLGTTFDQSVPVPITDSSAPSTFVGTFRPELANGEDVRGLDQFIGRNINQLTGGWTLRITDYDPNGGSGVTPELLTWSLHFTSGLNPVAYTTVATTQPAIRGSANSAYTIATGVNPLGFGPSPVVASDNTLGTASPHQGRMYLAYVDQAPDALPLIQGGPADQTAIFLRYSDNGGITWSRLIRVDNDQLGDGLQGLVRPVHFDPSIAVDQYTGTVAVSFFDSRYDPSRIRVTRFVAISQDGGLNFTNQLAVNQQQTATDAITRSTVQLQPIPDNEGGNGAKDTLGFGDHQGLAVADGRIYPVWASNLNASLDLSRVNSQGTLGVVRSLDIVIAPVVTAGGPRIINSTMGPIQPTTLKRFDNDASISFNNQTASDGSPEVNGFTVTFDRPIDPTTFTSADVTVIYHDPFTPATQPGTQISVGQIIRVYDPSLAPKASQNTYLVMFQSAQSGVGTYSYAVGPNIRDTIPMADGSGNTIQTGNLMDQNANAVTGENPGDVYDAPHTLHGILFQAPYSSDTLPLIVPGPHVVKTFVPGNPSTPDNLVLNKANNFIDVTFDRDMQANTFTSPQILRVVGPLGVIPGPYSVVADPQAGEDPNFPRTFRISFPLLAGSPNGRANGTYTFQFGPNIESKSGLFMDQNQNAGLDNLRTVSSTSNVTTSYTVQSPDSGLLLPPNTTTTSTLVVPKDFTIQGLTLHLNISASQDSDFVASLMAPDGTVVPLFTHVGANGNPQGFIDTVLDDNATTPITQGLAPFDGSFNPQTPLGVLIGKGSGGTYTLILENDSSSDVGALNSWSITFQQSVPGTGLAENVSDVATASFRIYTSAPGIPRSQFDWIPAGPTTNGGSGDGGGRISAIAVDPADPTGNIVYVGADTGGIWKTTNFLTSDPNGPTYIPLTDFGPNASLFVDTLAIFPRNNDPNQSIIFAGTGSPVNGAPVPGGGVGIIRSMDGGKTWQLLPNSGARVYKIVVDPTMSPQGNVIVYAATNLGVLKSIDTGKTWTTALSFTDKTLNTVLPATDVLLAPDSASVSTGNLQIVYAAFKDRGVYISPNQGNSWNLMVGGVGDPLIQDADIPNTPPVIVNPPGSSPTSMTMSQIKAPSDLTSSLTDIHLVTPFLVPDQTLLNKQYEGWLYANVGGQVFETKDFGQNWIRIRVPTAPRSVVDSTPVYPVIDKTQPDLPLGTQLAIDPTNPNIIYVDRFLVNDLYVPGMIRIDTTDVWDAHNFVAFTSQNNDGGQRLDNSGGALALKNINNYYGLFPEPLGGPSTPYLNLIRDPRNPFLDPFQENSTFFVTNPPPQPGPQFHLTDDGSGIRWSAFNAAFTDPLAIDGVDRFLYQGVDTVLTMVDPLTGHNRLIFGVGDGVYSAVDTGDGTLITNVGTVSEGTGNRTGTMQIAQFYEGATQPSSIAAQIANAFFYGDTPYSHPNSAPDAITTGNLNWKNGLTPGGIGVGTDQTGAGGAYHSVFPTEQGIGTDFFLVTTTPGSQHEISRTFGLIQQTGTSFIPDPQWETAYRFAVNPINPDQIVMGSGAGRVFRTEDRGRTWFVIADLHPGATPPANADLDGSVVNALAFGAPEPGQTENLDNFIYAGTNGGGDPNNPASPHVFVTFTGGQVANPGSQASGWTNLGAVDSAVQYIVADPVRGTHDAYVVTLHAVYYIPDSSAAVPQLINISGNLFQLTHSTFGDPTQSQPALSYLRALAADWRVKLPNDPQNPAAGTHPVLYVGGLGGVFRSTDNGKTWTIFPDVAHDHAFVDGGALPNAEVTSLSISYGNINPTTGQQDQSTGPGILYAATFGRGGFYIRLPNNVANSGPRVIAFSPHQGTGPVSSVTVTFNGAIDLSTFTLSSITTFRGPQGAITPTSITLGANNGADPNVHGVPGNQDRVFTINFPAQSANGTYTITFGPGIQDLSGDFMDQNRNGVNGEATDSYTGHFVISPHAGVPEYAVGADVGHAPEVIVYNAQTRAKLFDFNAYSASFTGGVRVAMGDVNNDGIPDIVTAPGKGMTPDVHVYDGATGLLIQDIPAFASTFTAGVYVAVADVNGDGYADIIAAKDFGGAPRVHIYSGKDFSLIGNFLAFPSTFTSGVRVAAGDVNGDGYADIITATGPGVAPTINVYSGKDLSLLRTITPYASTFTGGVNIAVGVINGTGRDDIITGTDSGPSKVKVFGGDTGTLLDTFFAFSQTFNGGVRVGTVADYTGDGVDKIVLGAGPGGNAHVKVWDPSTATLLDNFFAINNFSGGIFVGGH